MTERSEAFRDWVERDFNDELIAEQASEITAHLMEQYGQYCISSKENVFAGVYEAYEIWDAYLLYKSLRPTNYEARKYLEKLHSKLRRLTGHLGFKKSDFVNPNLSLDPWLQIYLKEAVARFTLSELQVPVVGGKEGEISAFGHYDHNLNSRMLDALAVLPALERLIETSLKEIQLPKTKGGNAVSKLGGGNFAERAALKLFKEVLETNFEFRFTGYPDANGEPRGPLYEEICRFFRIINPDFVSTGEKIKAQLKRIDEADRSVKDG